MGTALVTRIVGQQQTSIELPCSLHEFADTTELFNRAASTLGSERPFGIVVSHCPYGYIASAQRRGELVIATFHREAQA